MVDAGLEGLSQLSSELADFYRDLHCHPELSLQEHRTAGKVAAALRSAGVEVTEGVGGTGVVGVLGNGAGPVVLLRADFDALPVQEKTGLPYASTARATDSSGREVPVMHACGHDMHATCLVGAATMLARSTDTWSGTVLAAFQPAEELVCGAQDMIDDGLFERFPKPDIVLAEHVGPVPAGMIAHGSGTIAAASDGAHIVLHGRGGHGSRPEATVDPILMAANVVTRLQSIVSREISPFESAVVTVGRLQAGTKHNIIPDTAELAGTVRTRSPQIRTLVRAAVERIVHAEAAAAAAPKAPQVEWIHSSPILVSDPDATARTVAAFTAAFGEQRLLPLPPLNSSEDVGVLGTAAGVPTVYWFWGGLDTESTLASLGAGQLDTLPINHSPEFAPVAEPTLSTGIQALVVAARAWLQPALDHP
jgi:amidohydrolase